MPKSLANLLLKPSAGRLITVVILRTWRPLRPTSLSSGTTRLRGLLPATLRNGTGRQHGLRERHPE
ncbi:hypothetical protein EBR44_12665 [bacterium]|nr:hypothetical protein [bacterium]